MKRIMGLALPGVVPGLFAQGATERILTLDVAVDCRTFSYNRGVPLEQIVRGDGYILSSKVFPAGTLPPGLQTNDPNAPGSRRHPGATHFEREVASLDRNRLAADAA